MVSYTAETAAQLHKLLRSDRSYRVYVSFVQVAQSDVEISPSELELLAHVQDKGQSIVRYIPDVVKPALPGLLAKKLLKLSFGPQEEYSSVLLTSVALQAHYEAHE